MAAFVRPGPLVMFIPLSLTCARSSSIVESAPTELAKTSASTADLERPGPAVLMLSPRSAMTDRRVSMDADTSNTPAADAGVVTWEAGTAWAAGAASWVSVAVARPTIASLWPSGLLRRCRRGLAATVALLARSIWLALNSLPTQAGRH